MYFIYPAGAASDLLMQLAMGSALHLCICSAGVLFRHFVTAMKYQDKKHLWRKGFILAYSYITWSTIEEVETGTLTGQGLRGRSRCRGYGGVLFIHLYITAYSACSLITPGITSPGDTTHSDLGLPTSTINQENVPQACPYANLLETIFSVVRLHLLK